MDGRTVWIWDAYTTTDQYPYSQPIALDEVTTPPVDPGIPSLTGEANYVRNSVKVVIDAYDGSMTYYVADETDPIIQVWRNAFPELFTDIADAPAELQAHFRYPENLFQVQAAQYTSYHVEDPNVFYGKQDFWAVALDPTESDGQSQFLMRPYYVLQRLPGDEEETFSLILPFTPQGRANMVAWMAVNSDPGPEYGQITSYEFPSGRNVDGPTQVFARINQDAVFARERTLLDQSGSSVSFGDFLVVPIGDALLYVQPVYVRSSQATIPELRFVAVVNGDRIGLGENLTEALSDAVGETVTPPDGEPPPDGEEPPGEGTIDEQVAALLEEASGHFAAADEALRAGDLATYQAENEAAQQAIAQVLELLGTDSVTSPSPSPSASASPSG